MVDDSLTTTVVRPFVLLLVRSKDSLIFLRILFCYYIIADANFPHHPESVIVTSTSPTGVTIQWMLTEPFNATQPETFVVLYSTTQDRPRTSTSMVIATATSQTYSIQLNSLDIGTQYYFQVQSRNRFGSIVSNVMDFTTDDTSELSTNVLFMSIKL